MPHSTAADVPSLSRIWVESPLFSNVTSLLPSQVKLTTWPGPPVDVAESAAGAEAILASSRVHYDAALFERLPALRVMSRTGIGIDNIDLNAATEHGVAVCNTPDGPTQSTAEHTVALLLAVCKRVKAGNANLAAGQWGPRPTLTGMEVQGKTLGLIGLGRIGRKVAQICRLGLEMQIVAHDPFVSEQEAESLGVTLLPLDDLLAQAHVVSIHVPSLPETHHLINAARLAQMRDGSVLLNLARGPLVDPNALLTALDSGKLLGAGLDVFTPEPPALGSPLRDHPRIIATPHVATNTVDGRRRIERMAVENLLTFFRGERPPGLCNRELAQ